MRFDFSFDRALTAEELSLLEECVNRAIAQDLAVSCSVMSLGEAKKCGAIGVFEDKYEEKVKVYAIGNVSLEICGGPHVKSTKELGHFSIIQQKSISAGIRRLKAILK
jgi:alanyl-tRNA synthetase